MDQLSKRLWRHILAGGIADKAGEFREQYQALDIELKQQLKRLIQSLLDLEKLTPEAPVEQLTEILFALQNSRFIQYMASDSMSSDESEALFKADVDLVLRQFLPV